MHQLVWQGLFAKDFSAALLRSLRASMGFLCWLPNCHYMGFPQMGVPKNRWYTTENPLKNEWLGGTPILGNLHIHVLHRALFIACWYDSLENFQAIQMHREHMRNFAEAVHAPSSCLIVLISLPAYTLAHYWEPYVARSYVSSGPHCGTSGYIACDARVRLLCCCVSLLWLLLEFWSCPWSSCCSLLQ